MAAKASQAKTREDRLLKEVEELKRLRATDKQKSRAHKVKDKVIVVLQDEHELSAEQSKKEFEELTAARKSPSLSHSLHKCPEQDPTRAAISAAGPTSHYTLVICRGDTHTAS
uniref:Uncharacterized protein n=1 Tax=Knipowitschia caucasica TaxID=637954 RepID=A0AAV2J519_KNICA